jgi:cytochrome c peroxidase
MTSYIAFGAFMAAGAVVAACSSDDGASTPETPATADGGPQADGAAPDTSTPDASAPIIPADVLTQLKQQSPLPAVPADPTNAFADNAAAAVLGQRLYFDPSFSGAIAVAGTVANGGLGAAGETGKVSCISCHSSDATDDGRTKPNNVSLGTDYGTRNALPIANSSFYTWTNWGGRFDSQWSLPLAVAENAKIMNSTRLQVAHLLWDKYKADYNAIFPVPLDTRLDPLDANAANFPPAGKPGQAAWDTDVAAADKAIINRIFANFGKAIAAYVRLNVSRNAPFDRFLAGDATAMSADAQRGAVVFVGKGKCVQCHSGPNFSDDKFHNLGAPQTGPNVPATDNGRYADIPALLASPFNTSSVYSDNTTTGKLTGLVASDPANIAQFRTKSLRGLVSGSAPFMHAGQLATLDDVVKFYSQGGGDSADGGVKDAKMTAVNLTASESADLVAFLQALQGEPVAAALRVNTAR